MAGPSHGHSGSAQKIVKIGPAVPEICSPTDRRRDRQTDRQAYRNTPLPYRGGVIMIRKRLFEW